MLDTDTFLTLLYVMADDFCKSRPPIIKPGKNPSLSEGEILTLALYSQFYKFDTERDFYRHADSKLRAAFPELPHRTQFNRLLRGHHDLIVQFFLHINDHLEARQCPFEALDGTAVPTRNCKRRGEGHLAGQADIGYSKRLGWYEGFHLLVSVSPTGIVTGFGFASASTKDQELAETFFALRAAPEQAARHGLAGVGLPARGPYAGDKGFEGHERYRHWRQCYGAEVITAPKSHEKQRHWPKALRRWLASIRQLVETSIGHLQRWFDLGEDRPHALSGFRARLAAKMALHNFCIWLNRKLGRADLAFAGLIDW